MGMMHIITATRLEGKEGSVPSFGGADRIH